MKTSELILWVCSILIIGILFIYGFAGNFIESLQVFLALGSIVLFVIIMLIQFAIEEKGEK